MKNETTQHTPTPWKVHAEINVFGPDGSSVLGKTSNSDPGVIDEVKANAAFIVRAVNAHEELLAMVKILHPDHAPVTRCDACTLIAKAEGR